MDRLKAQALIGQLREEIRRREVAPPQGAARGNPVAAQGIRKTAALSGRTLGRQEIRRRGRPGVGRGARRAPERMPGRRVRHTGGTRFGAAR